MTNKQLLGRLARAQHCCINCGNKYGKCSNDQVSTFYKGKCDICKKRIDVTEVGDYEYFYKFATNLKKEIDKETKKKAKVKKSQTPSKLWETASIAMQEYYRSLGLECAICPKLQTVMHHWQAYGRSKYLRFTNQNLVPLCKECHCKFHAGDIEAHYNIQQAMSKEWGVNWEPKLIKDSHKEFKLSAPELRDYLNDKIEYYNNLKNDKN